MGSKAYGSRDIKLYRRNQKGYKKNKCRKEEIGNRRWRVHNTKSLVYEGKEVSGILIITFVMITGMHPLVRDKGQNGEE
jgi:hypothetical protein